MGIRYGDGNGSGFRVSSIERGPDPLSFLPSHCSKAIKEANTLEHSKSSSNDEFHRPLDNQLLPYESTTILWTHFRVGATETFTPLRISTNRHHDY